MCRIIGEALILLFIPFPSESIFAQRKLTDIEGIKFGLDKESVKALLLEKGIKYTDYGGEDKYQVTDLRVESFPFGKAKTDYCSFMFNKNKFFSCYLSFLPSRERVDTILKLYDEIKSMIIKKYGKPTSNIKGRIEADSLYTRYKAKFDQEHGEGVAEKYIGAMPSYDKVELKWEKS